MSFTKICNNSITAIMLNLNYRYFEYGVYVAAVQVTMDIDENRFGIDDPVEETIKAGFNITRSAIVAVIAENSMNHKHVSLLFILKHYCIIFETLYM